MRHIKHEDKIVKVEKSGWAKEVGRCLRHQTYIIWDPTIDYDTIKKWHDDREFGDGDSFKLEYKDNHIIVTDIIDSSG